MRYKKEVFLIKGRYYASSILSLVEYGAIEGSITTDDYHPVQVIKWFCPNMIIIRHGHKWGLFPSICVCAEELTDYASEDDNPFIYDSFRLLCHEDAEHNNELFDSFILLNTGEKWHAVKIEIGEGLVAKLIKEPALETDSDIALFEAIEEKYRMNLRFRDLSENEAENNKDNCDTEELREFDVDRDFVQRYYNSFDDCSNTTSFMRMILFDFPYQYWYDINLYYAVAHRSPHAALIIGKHLLDEVTKGIARDKESGDNCYKPDESYYNKRLGNSIEYLKQAKRYADESGDTTLSDIAWLYMQKAEDLYNERQPRAKQPVRLWPTPPKPLKGEPGAPIPIGYKRE